jgi:hypothetical protein
VTALAASSVLKALGPGQPIYAVLDGARDRRVRGFVLDSRAPAWCLYRGELPPEIEDVAPWLLRLDPLGPAARRFFELGWGHAWGFLLASDAPARDLRRHLRRFLLAHGRGGERLLFRYYDPRVLHVYLRSCAPEERARFFGPISAMAVEHARGADLFRPAAQEQIPCP